MVDAPAAEPRAVVLLLREEPLDALIRGVAIDAERPQRLERMRGDVGARLVGDLAEVAERDLVEPHCAVVHVEGAPAAVARLHPDEPLHAALDRGLLADAHPVEGKREDGRVVDVGVVVVLVLEGPAAGSEVGPADRPVALDAHLLREQVLPRAHELRVVVRDAAGAEREQGQSRVPDGRLARLGPQPLAVLDHEAPPPFHRLAEHRVVEPVAERRKRDDPPHPRRLDPAPRAVRLLPLADPALGDRDRPSPQRVRAARRPRAPGDRADGCQVDVRRPHGAQRLRDRERDERACPRDR